MFNILLITAESFGQWFLISLNTVAILIMILKYLKDNKKDKKINNNEIFQEKLVQEKRINKIDNRIYQLEEMIPQLLDTAKIIKDNQTEYIKNLNKTINPLTEQIAVILEKERTTEKRLDNIDEHMSEQQRYIIELQNK